MATAYEAFLPYLMPLVPHAPEPTAVYALRNACIDFCRGSLVWQDHLDPVSTSANIAEYELDVPANTALVQPMTLYYDGTKLLRKSVSEISSKWTRDWYLLRGTPSVFTMLNPDEITLVLCPDVSLTNAITGIFALQPTRASTTCADLLLERYAEAIAAGAAAKLLAIPNEPFNDPKNAVVYDRNFKSAIHNALNGVNAGQNRAPMRVRMNRMF